VIHLVHARTDKDTPVLSGAKARCVGRWDGQASVASVWVSDDETEVARYTVADGEIVVIGHVYELISEFTPDMAGTRGIEHLGHRDGAGDVLDELTRANGRFVAVVVAGIDPVSREELVPGTLRVTVVADRISSRTLYYGTAGGTAVVNSSPQLVSDALGLGREINAGRVVDYVVNRNPVDDQTLFRGVRRLYCDEMLRVAPGETHPHRIDLAEFAMRGGSVEDPSDPLYRRLGTGLLRRAVRIRVNYRPNQAVTLLTSGGLDSRVLMAIAAEVGADVQAITIGKRTGFDESRVAADFARRHGYPCRRFMEEDLDLRGHLEPYLAATGFPPKYYNHLLLAAAVSELGQREGQLWTGDMGTGSISGFAPISPGAIRASQSRHGALVARALRALLPIHSWLPKRLREPLWLLSLSPEELAGIAVCPERTLRNGRNVMSLLGRRSAAFDPAPHFTDGLARGVGRHRLAERHSWWCLFNDHLFASSLISRRLIARRLGLALDYPLKDVTLFSFAQGFLANRPDGKRIGRNWKQSVYEHFIPRSEWIPNRGLVGDLARWFRDPRKLGEYRDVIASRECAERGIFDRRGVRRLLDKSEFADAGGLSRAEARALWTVLTMELLFKTDVLRSTQTDFSSGPTSGSTRSPQTAESVSH